MHPPDASTPPAASSPPRPGSTAVVAGTLAGAMAIGPLPLFAIMALGPLVIPDLALSRTAFGSVTTIAFVVGLAGSLLAGRLVDRVGARRVALGMVGMSSAAIIVISGAQSFVWLVGAATLGGMAQAASNPTTNVLVTTEVPPSLRGTLMGVKQSGVQMGQFLAGATLPTLAVLVGWRVSALAALVLTATVLVLLLATASQAAPTASASPDPGADRGRPHATAPGSAPESGRTGSPWWLLAYTFLVAVVEQAVNAYVPLYAFEDVGLSAAAAGSAVGVIGVIGVAARIGVGWASGRFAAPETLLLAVAAAGSGAMLAVAASAVLGPALLWLGVATYAATALAANVLVMTTLLHTVKQGRMGRASGIVQMAMFGGFATGPIAFGALVDLTASFVVGWLVVAGVFAAAAVLAVIGRTRTRATLSGATTPP